MSNNVFRSFSLLKSMLKHVAVKEMMYIFKQTALIHRFIGKKNMKNLTHVLREFLCHPLENLSLAESTCQFCSIMVPDGVLERIRGSTGTSLLLQECLPLAGKTIDK